MATGFRIPFVQNRGSGGINIDEGDDYIKGLLLVALHDCESTNPFQGLGIGNHIFKLDGPTFRAVVTDRIRNVFKQFKADKLAELAPNGLEFLDSESEGEVVLSVKYVDLETDEVNDLVTTYPSG